MAAFDLITPDNAAHLTEIARARCGFITDLVWSPVGSTLAVAHGGGVWLWVDQFGAAPTVRLLSDAPIKGLAFSPDGRTLVTGSSDTFVRLWDVTSGECVQTFSGHASSVEDVAFASGGDWIASCSVDRTIRLFDRADPEQARVLRGHDDEVTCVAFDPSTRYVVSGSRDGSVRLWSPASGQEQRRIAGHRDWVRDLALSADGRWVASASRDATVRVTALDSGEDYAILAHDGDSRAVAFSPDSRLIAASDLQILCLWDVETGTPIARLAGHDRPILALAFHPHGALLASGGGDNTLRLWAVTGESKRRPE